MIISTLEVASAQDRLEAAIADLEDADMRVDSRCAGWTRGHVLSHVARNADGLANLATWALTGQVTPMYASPEARNGDIDAGATRSADQVIADIVETNDRILTTMGALEGAVAVDPSIAAREVRLGDPATGPAVAARDLPFLRLQEVVVHHHDLDIGTTAADLPRAYVEVALPRVAERIVSQLDKVPSILARDDDVEVEVTAPGGGTEVVGRAADVLVWLLGRSDPADRDRLTVGPDGTALPELPDY